MQRIRLYRSDDLSEFAFYRLEDERARQVFRDEEADIRRQHAALQSQIESWLGTTRVSWRVLNVAVVFARGSDLVVMVRAETTDLKRRMRTYPARQLDCVRIAFVK